MKPPSRQTTETIVNRVTGTCILVGIVCIVVGGILWANFANKLHRSRFKKGDKSNLERGKKAGMILTFVGLGLLAVGIGILSIWRFVDQKHTQQQRARPSAAAVMN